MVKGPTVITVSQINTYIKSMFDSSSVLQNIYISGEISNFTNHYRSGHYYFTLKDEKAAIKAVMFHSHNERLRFNPQNGMKVLVRGRVSVYDRDGVYQLYAEDMQPDGFGALNLAFEQRKEKLAAEGLFEQGRKLPLPRFPMKIGVITSPTGAAVRDILNVLSRRFPLAQVVFCPVQVQGDAAAPQISQAIRRFSQTRAADVLIVGRGGGSLEDLWAFNEEMVARAVADCTIPVISAVGHETDFTICDFVSDLRAPTPSAAAELAVPDQYAQQAYVYALLNAMKKNLRSLIDMKKSGLAQLSGSAVLRSPAFLLQQRQQRTDAAGLRLSHAFRQKLNGQKARFSTLCGKLHTLSPFQVLSRGYAIAYDETKKPIRTIEGRKAGESIRVEVSDGALTCRISSIAGRKKGKDTL